MKDYLGEDLILAMGAPGSKWSSNLRMLGLLHKEINLTDENNRYTYSKEYTNQYNRKVKIGWHRGAYWGPNHEQGHNFDNLQNMSKLEIIEEFKKPFTDWNSGIKIIKSHWFSYHIPQLMEMFPRSRLLAFYANDTECFNWWKEVGGWDITYPHYQWYKNDNVMKKQISIENSNILKYFDIKSFRDYELGQELNLSTDVRSFKEVLDVDNSIQESYNPRFTEDQEKFNELVNMVVSKVQMGVIVQ